MLSPGTFFTATWAVYISGELKLSLKDLIETFTKAGSKKAGMVVGKNPSRMTIQHELKLLSAM